MPLQITEVFNENGLENMHDTQVIVPSPSGRLIPVFEYNASDLQHSLTAYRVRREAFRYDEMWQSVLVNDSGDYDLLMIAIPVNEEDTLIEWKKTYRTQFSVPPNSLLLQINGWVDGVEVD